MTTTIVLNEINFGYSSRRPVFENFNLELDTFPTVVLGPNGAGKSSLLGLLAGQLRPRSGAVTLGQGTMSKRRNTLRLRSQTGWLPQDVRPVAGLNVREQVAYSGWLKGMRYKSAWLSAERVLGMTDLGDMLGRSAGRLSGGQRRRLGIAQALVHSPSLIVLDEPYAGLDPEQRSLVRQTLIDLAVSASLVVSTHQTEDIEDVYKHVLILDEGELMYSGSTPEFFAEAPPEVPAAARAEVAYRAIMEKYRAGRAR